MKKYILLVTAIMLSGCGVIAVNLENTGQKQSIGDYQIYPDHLDYLCENITLPNGKASLITNIYCDAPDYKYADAPGEGISCIDDVARAGVFYMNYYKETGKSEYLDKVNRCVEFVLYMQQKNQDVSGYGYFYNFILDKKGTINKDGITSKAEPNWWTWRAMWFLGYVYPEIKKVDPVTADNIKAALDLSFSTIKKDFTFEGKVETEQGIRYADWLPNDASDQSAIILMSLVYYEKINGNKDVTDIMNKIADGLLIGQIKDKKSDVYGAFMCYKNSWHGWGNNIAYSLLLAGQELGNNKYIKAGLLEIDHFQKYLIENDYYKEFNVKKESNSIVEVIPSTEKKFEQIAYAMGPMILACLKAYEITGNDKYLNQAETLAQWFFGVNPANVTMYNPIPDKFPGIVYDGINSETDYNKNSGAESTIEALLALQQLRVAKQI